jgi:hypothetical protein
MEGGRLGRGREHAVATDARNADLAARLTPDIRRTIIEIKAAVWSDPGYRRTFHSQDVYEAVLQYGVTDVEAFRDLLRRRRDGG